jgi:cardiolipin synthase
VSKAVPYRLFDEPADFYRAMQADISRAKRYIYLETYKFADDIIGKRFRDILVQKAKEGVEIRLLIDSWGSFVNNSYFAEMINYGGQVRFFMKVKFFIDFFTKNHRRNHRKLLIIDDRISYIGSANITGYSLKWKELMLRMEGEIAIPFKKVFNLDFSLYKRYLFEKNSYIRTLKHDVFEIIRDVPSITKKRISKKYIQLIRNAEREVVIETPYFLPGFLLRKAMADACKRGVKIKVIIPKNSDVGLVDILRNRYLGPMNEKGVEILYYVPTNLHGKAILVDDEIFSIGSPNFDYRSFRYMHEIVLVGAEPEIARQLREHLDQIIKDCVPFVYDTWKHRPRFQKAVEWLLLPFRHLL